MPASGAMVASSRRPSAGGMSTSTASSATPSNRPSLTRRTSLEEDYFYREVMTITRTPTEPPPSYESTLKKIRRQEREEAAAAAAAASAAATAAAVAEQTSALSEPEPEPEPATPAREKGKARAKSKAKAKAKEKDMAPLAPVRSIAHSTMSGRADEVLPAYSCDIHVEGVFQRKMEIENATKRAEDRRWGAAYVVLHGTALHIHQCRKDRSWRGRTARAGPGVSPDRPPWMRKAALQRSYNLSYADVGIAADYAKRRYVIRVRAETDQFLLACIELETFVHWLDAFFAALSVAAPIDERDFPRDQSIPRVHRIRWFYGREREEERAREIERDSGQESEPEDDVGGRSRSGSTSSSSSNGSEAAAAANDRQAGARSGSVSSGSSSSSMASASTASTAAGPSTAAAAAPSTPHPPPPDLLGVRQRAAARAMLSDPSSSSSPGGGARAAAASGGSGGRFSLRAFRSRLAVGNGGPSGSSSSSSGGGGGGGGGVGSSSRALPSDSGPVRVPYDAADVATDKWQPRHRWTKTHDMVYAKLCYATLLFRSPRKSNYIIVRGKQWLVDWSTGNMVRVSPPFYGEIEQPGPWQILRTENARI